MAQPWNGTVPGNIYYNQGNVGIGVTNPRVKLNVDGGNIIIDNPEYGIAGSDISVRGTWSGSWARGFSVLNCAYNVLSEWGSVTRDANPQVLDYAYWGTSYISPWIAIKGGNIGIGTTSPEAKLTVKGKIIASEIQIKDVGVIPDYVFKPGYELMSLSKVEDFVKQNQHLPEVPSEKEFKENGMNMAEMNALLLKKIEELTLYAIDQNKNFMEQTIYQNKRLIEQAKRIETLEKTINISNTK